MLRLEEMRLFPFKAIHIFKEKASYERQDLAPTIREDILLWSV